MIQTAENIGEPMFDASKYNDVKVSEKHSLFLGDLSIYCDEKDIAAAFAPYGNIVDIRIQRSKETSRALSYGFIEFDTEESAAVALREMNYFLLKGRPLRIRWAAGRTTPIKSTTTPHDSAATVYVRFLTLEDNVEITEESLRTLFNQYGPVFDCAIKKLAQEQKGTRIKGYAFVSFDSGALAKGSVDVVGVEAALRVCTELRNRVIDNVRYRCELGNRLQKQAASMGMAPALMPAMACAPMGGYTPVPSVMYASPGSQLPQPPPQVQVHQQQMPYHQQQQQQQQQQQIGSGRTDDGCHYSPQVIMSPYSSNPSTPTNHQLRMNQLAQQQQQQLHMSYLQQQQQQQPQYRAPHPGYTPVPTPTNLNNAAPVGTALQMLQQQPQSHPQTPGGHAKHPQDQHLHPGQGPVHGHTPNHTPHHTPSHGQGHGQNQGQGHSNSNGNYQAQLLAQAQAQLQAQALAQAALHAQQAQQTQQVQQVSQMHTLPPQYLHCSPPQQLPQQQAYLSRGPSGYNSGAATPVSNARLQAQQQQQQYGQVNMNNMSMPNMQNMQNMQMVNTPEGVIMMVPMPIPMSMPVQGPPQGMHSTGYPPYMTAQQAYTPRAYTPTAYAQQQAYQHPGQHTTRSLQQHQHQQQSQQQHQPPPPQHALQQHATQQQGILKELSCSQYFAQKGIRLSIKTHTVEESPPMPVAPAPRSHSADNTPREAYLQRKLNSTPRRAPYNNSLYTNYTNTGSNNNLHAERGPVSRRGSNDSVNTTSLYIGDLSIDEAAEYAESTPNSGKDESSEIEAVTPTTATSATTEL